MLLEEKDTGIYFKLFDMDKYREQRVADGKDFMIDLDFDFLKISIDEDNNTALITEDTIYSAIWSTKARTSYSTSLSLSMQMRSKDRSR